MFLLGVAARTDIGDTTQALVGSAAGTTLGPLLATVQCVFSEGKLANSKIRMQPQKPSKSGHPLRCFSLVAKAHNAPDGRRVGALGI